MGWCSGTGGRRIRLHGDVEASLAYMSLQSPSAVERPHPLTPCPLCHLTVKEKLRLDPDSEIATTGVRVSLICPVSPRLSPHTGGPRSLWDSVLTACPFPDSW